MAKSFSLLIVVALIATTNGCMTDQPSVQAPLGRLRYAGKDYSETRKAGSLLVVQCTADENHDISNEDMPAISELLKRISPEKGQIRNAHLNSHRNCIYLKGEVADER